MKGEQESTRLTRYQIFTTHAITYTGFCCLRGCTASLSDSLHSDAYLRQELQLAMP